VAICTDARNVRSRTAIVRIGATFEGVLRSHRPSYVAGEEGVLRDTAVHSIVASEWPDVKAELERRLA
jgi:RimJ/RimL family protein N-acetyltransferase